MKDLRNLFGAITWLATLALLQAALHLLGRETYALPAFDAGSLRTWIETTDITIVVLSALRIIAMMAIWYIVATTAAVAVLHRSPWKRVAQLVEPITLPSARIFAIRLAGISAIGSLAIPATTAHAAPRSEAPVLRHLLPGEAAPSFATSTTTTATPTTAPQPTIAPEAIVEQTPSKQHTVKRGENFWKIAQDSLTTSLHREPTEKEIVTYWRTLVKANQQQLADSKNPDLLFAGQVIELPPLPVSVQSGSRAHH